MRSEALVLTIASVLIGGLCQAEDAVRQTGGLWGPEGLGKTDRLMPLITIPKFASFVPVTVDQFQIQPGADITFFDAHLELHPKAEVGVGYNSNVDLTDTAAASRTVNYGLGLDGVLAIDVNTKVVMLTFIGYQQYSNDQTSDVASYQASLEYVHSSRWASYDATGSIERNNNPQPDTGEQIPMVIGSGEASIKTFKDSPLGLGLTVMAEQTNYLENGTDFTAASRENIYGFVAGSVGHRFDSGLFGNAAVGYEQRRYRSTVDYNDSDGVWATVGGGMQLASRTSFSLNAGPAVRFYGADFNHDPAYHDQVVPWVLGNAALEWEWTENAQLLLQMNSSLGDGISSNAVHSLSINLRQLIYPLRRWYAGGLLGVGFNENSGAPAGQDIGYRNTAYGGLEAVYGIYPGVAMRFNVVINTQIINDAQATGVVTGAQLGAAF